MGVKAKTVVDARETSKNGKFSHIPPLEKWDLSSHEGASGKKPAFIYYCDNETVDGVEFASSGPQAFPFDKVDKDVPIVCDASSNFLSRPIDISKFGIVYAGAQKNLGPAGVSVVIVRDDLIGRSALVNAASLSGY
jgi:phosphoserine aminotransferase